MITLEYPLDENGFLRLTLEHAPGNELHAQLHSTYGENSSLVKNILPLLSLGGYTPDAASFTLPVKDFLTLQINGRNFARISVTQKAITAESQRKLCVFETRIIGRAPQRDMPSGTLSDMQPQTPITDLHTHLSAQISAQDLIEMGCSYHLPYPTAMLDSLQIDYPKDKLTQAPKRSFLPLGLQYPAGKMEALVPLDTLPPQELAKLSKALIHSPERQETFIDMEMCYYLREPFTKNRDLFAQMLARIAAGYKKQGITYAELSSNAVLDPEWLRIAHDVLPDIEVRTGVSLRFMAGLPRTLDETALAARIEQIKRISPSPYIVGVDIFGHEINKTSHLLLHLNNLAKWLHTHQPDTILQIHAGENSKNPKNAIEALQIAKAQNIRVRLIHALHGMDSTTLTLARELAEKKRILIAYCPDSNIALNHIDFAYEMDLMQSIDAGIPSVLASDGASFYSTSARQIAQAGALCGVTTQGFKAIRHTEEAHITRQQQIFEQKLKALPADFFENAAAPKTTLSPLPALAVSDIIPLLQKLLAGGKKPLLIAGAAGTSWDAIKVSDREEVITGLNLLLKTVDPDKVYFVGGRTKDRGVGIELGKAIAEYNRIHPARSFEYVVMEAQSPQGIQHEDIGISHRLRLAETIGASPSAIIDFVKKQNGAALFFGGRQLTRDFILTADNKALPFGLMVTQTGYEKTPNASMEKFRIYNECGFKGAAGLVEKAFALLS